MTITVSRYTRSQYKYSRCRKTTFIFESNKICRPDELPSRLLRTVAQELAPALTFLFNQSYTTGIVHMQWKRALVTGVFKKGAKLDPANYRPILLTCLCCKVMEHIVLSQLAKHLSANNILLDSQHGLHEKQ